MDIEFKKSVVNLNQLHDKSTWKQMRTMLEQKGWCQVVLPNQIQQKLKDFVLANKNYMSQTPLEEKRKHFSAPIYGYQKTEFKEAITFLTDEMLSDKETQEALISKTTRQVTVEFIDTVDKFFSEFIPLFYESVIGLMDFYDPAIPFTRKFKDIYNYQEQGNEIPQITKQNLANNSANLKSIQTNKIPTNTVNNVANRHSASKSYGMIDMVQYFNQKEFNMQDHEDPGLISLSFFQDQEGLQLKDENGRWISPELSDFTHGVLWCGFYAQEISNNQLKGGAHRVQNQIGKPRFTTWYEVCQIKQVSEEIDKAGSMLALRSQNDSYNQFFQQNYDQKSPNLLQKMGSYFSNIIQPTNQSKNEKITLSIKYSGTNAVVTQYTAQSSDQIGQLKYLLEDKLGIRFSKSIQYLHMFDKSNQYIQDGKTFADYGIKDGDSIYVQKSRTNVPQPIKPTTQPPLKF